MQIKIKTKKQVIFTAIANSNCSCGAYLHFLLLISIFPYKNNEEAKNLKRNEYIGMGIYLSL